MRTQVATFPNIGDVALGKGAVSPIANAGGIEALGDEVIVALLKQLIDSRDDVRRGPFAWCYGGARQRQGSTSATTQSHMGSDLDVLTHDGHIFDEKCKDLLALAIDYVRMGPKPRNVRT